MYIVFIHMYQVQPANEESVVASQPQTTISSEAEISREQRGSQEPSSEFALHVVPLESGGDIAESDSQLSIITVHVDSSESFLTESITQSTSSPQSQEGEETVEEGEGAMATKAFISSGSGLVEGEETLATIVVGIVEPERADQQAKPVEETLISQGERVERREQLQGAGVEGDKEEEEEEDREAVGETRDEEGEETMEEFGVEGTDHVKDATREQADTTQKFEEGT